MFGISSEKRKREEEEGEREVDKDEVRMRVMCLNHMSAEAQLSLESWYMFPEVPLLHYLCRICFTITEDIF